MKLPILVSVPHAGLEVPPEAQGYVSLTLDDIVADGDGGAAEIYSIGDKVTAFVTTGVARAIVDVNRAEDDIGGDGMIKTRTCWGTPVYGQFPPEHVIAALIEKYYRPYHKRLTRLAAAVRLGLDCHTMAESGPPVSPDPGAPRPFICLGDGHGAFPAKWTRALAANLEQAFGEKVSINDPFSGGYITRVHGTEIPWAQLEFSRTARVPDAEKREKLLAALEAWFKSM